MSNKILRRENLICVCVFVMGEVFFGLYSVWKGQDINWDQRNYHFYTAYALVHNRLDYDFLPAQLQNFFNPVLHLPFYFLSTNLSPKGVGFVLGAIHGLNFFLVFLLSRALLKNLTVKCGVALSLLLAVTGIYTPTGWSLVGTTNGDNVTSLFVVASLWVLVRNGAGPLPHWDFYISGLLLGLAAGLKYVNLIYVGALLATVFLTVFFQQRLITALVSMSLGVVTGIGAAAGIWLWRMWEKFHNPLFPFFNRIFQSPYTTLSLGEGIFSRVKPDTVLEAFSYPFYWLTVQNTTAEFPFRDARWAILVILSLAALFAQGVRFMRKRKNNSGIAEQPPLLQERGGRVIILFVFLGFCLWMVMFSYHRYLFSLELLAGITIVWLIDCFSLRQTSKLVVSSSLCVLVMISVKVPERGHAQWDREWFGVTAPPIAAPAETVVLIVGLHAISYVIPFFPHEVRFVRIVSNLGVETTRLGEEIRDFIEQHDGSFLVMRKGDISPRDRNTLARHHIVLVPGACVGVPSRLDRDLKLCQAFRSSS